MNQEIRTILETPFTADQIKQRKGLWGKILDYIEGHSVIQRLNDAFASEWSFSVIDYQIQDKEVIVLGQIQVHGIVKQQFGSSAITRDSQSGEMLCLGDDLKSAGTDALKKCATLLGVGLSLYGEASPPTKQVPAETPSTTETNVSGKAVPPASNPSNGNGNGNRNTNHADGITPKQKKYCLTLGRRHNMDANEVNRLCVETFTVPFDELSKSQASELITMLTE